MSVSSISAAVEAAVAKCNERANACLRADDVAGAKKALSVGQHDLRNLKREAANEEREIRAAAQQARIEINKQGQVLGLIGGSKVRGAAARGRAMDKRKLAQKQQDALLPYQRLKAAIDDALAQLEGYKLDLKDGVLDGDVVDHGDDPAPPPPPPPQAVPATPAQWAADPTGRHELRYWNGSTWTDHVSDAGSQAVDPIS